MSDTNLIERVLEAHEVSVQITGPWGEVARVSVAVPDLRSAPRHVQGDWGPMYTITMPADRSIDVSVLTAADRESRREAIDADWLQVESPMLATTRETTPLVMKLPLRRQGLTLNVYYDTQGNPTTAELRPLPGEVNRYESYDARVVHVEEEEIPAPVLDWSTTATEERRANHA